MLDKQVMLREEKTGSWREQNTWQANLTWGLLGVELCWRWVMTFSRFSHLERILTRFLREYSLVAKRFAANPDIDD